MIKVLEGKRNNLNEMVDKEYKKIMSSYYNEEIDGKSMLLALGNLAKVTNKLGLGSPIIRSR